LTAAISAAVMSGEDRGMCIGGFFLTTLKGTSRNASDCCTCQHTLGDTGPCSDYGIVFDDQRLLVSAVDDNSTGPHIDSLAHVNPT